MLMMMVSLSSFAQYPTTKKIKGQQVVIMTVKQAEAINTKFDILEDSIDVLNYNLTEYTSNLNGCETSLNFTQDKLETTSSNLNHMVDSLVKIDRFYQKEIKRVEKLEWVEKRTRVRLGFGIAAVVVTWLIIVVSVIKS